jgi:hypothetical protein
MCGLTNLSCGGHDSADIVTITKGNEEAEGNESEVGAGKSGAEMFK